MRGPNLGSVTMFEVFELIMTQAIIGRNARPDVTGLKCFTSLQVVGQEQEQAEHGQPGDAHRREGHAA